MQLKADNLLVPWWLTCIAEQTQDVGPIWLGMKFFSAHLFSLYNSQFGGLIWFLWSFYSWFPLFDNIGWLYESFGLVGISLRRVTDRSRIYKNLILSNLLLELFLSTRSISDGCSIQLSRSWSVLEPVDDSVYENIASCSICLWSHSPESPEIPCRR